MHFSIFTQIHFDIVQENGKIPQGNGIGKSIANFFKNIGHSKDDLQPASQNNRLASKQHVASTSTPQFPPILLDSRTLQADASKKSPSPQPGDRRPSAPTNSDTNSSQDELSPTVTKSQLELLSLSLDDVK